MITELEGGGLQSEDSPLVLLGCQLSQEVISGKFLSFNVRGLDNPVKRVAILDLLRKQEVHIAMLQETHIVRRDVNRLSNRVFHVVAHSSTTNKPKGVVIICRRNLHFKLLDTWTDNEGRIAIAKVHIGNNDITRLYLCSYCL